jgi:hypothetical protein
LFARQFLLRLEIELLVAPLGAAGLLP